MLSTMDPTVGTFAGSIVEPIDVLTMDIHILMEDILLTPMEATGWATAWAMEATEAMEATGWAMEAMEDIIAHPISGDGVIN